MLLSHYVRIRGLHLSKYVKHSGGGMTGGYYKLTIKPGDDRQALIRVESAEWHNEEPKVNEYQVDSAVLDEIERVILAHRMNHWNRKKFTRLFIADGESKGYTFEFGEKTISFSSQVYHAGYAKTLRELDEIAEKYISEAEGDDRESGTK